MEIHARTNAFLSQMAVVLLLSSAPLLGGAVQCPASSVSVNSNGSLMFRPLSAGSDNVDASFDPGVIGGWYSLSSGFVDAVRSGSLPYGE